MNHIDLPLILIVLGVCMVASVLELALYAIACRTSKTPFPLRKWGIDAISFLIIGVAVLICLELDLPFSKWACAALGACAYGLSQFVLGRIWKNKG